MPFETITRFPKFILIRLAVQHLRHYYFHSSLPAERQRGRKTLGVVRQPSVLMVIRGAVLYITIVYKKKKKMYYDAGSKYFFYSSRGGVWYSFNFILKYESRSTIIS